MALAVIKSGQNANNLYDFAVMNYTLYMVNGIDRNQAYAGDSCRNMGLDAPKTLRTGFTTGGATASAGTTVVLDTAASTTNNAYKGGIITIDGIVRIITSYVGSTRTATVNAAWGAVKAEGTAYTIIQHCVATNGTSGLIDGGTYGIKITFYDQDHDIESNASAVVTATSVAASGKITLTFLPHPVGQSNVTHWKIYRTLASGTTYYLDQPASAENCTIESNSLVKIDSWAGDESVVLSLTDDSLSVLSAYNGTFENNTFLTAPFIEAGKNRVFMAGPVRYNTGTVQVANGSTSVLGVGTEFASGNIGLDFVIADNYYAYEVSTVESDTRLTLASAYAETSAPAGSVYAIVNNCNTVVFSEKVGNALYPESINRTGNWVLAEPGDNDEITGLQRIGDDDFIIFKKNHQYRLQGTDEDNFDAPGFLANEGAAGNWGIENVDGYIVYNTPDAGIHRTTGSGMPENISAAIENFLANDTIAETRNKYAFLKFFKRERELWCALTAYGSTTNDLVYVWKPDIGQWFKYTGIYINCMEEVTDSNGLRQLYTGDAHGWVWKQDSGTNDGVPGGTVKGRITGVSSSTSTSTSTTSSTSTSTSTTTSTTTTGA